MLGKAILSQIFAIPSAIVTHVAGTDIFGSVPLWVPVGAWVFVSVLVLWELRE